MHRYHFRLATGLLPGALLAAALTAGCSAVFRQPEVRLETVRLAGVGLSGATLVARLHISNPNGFGLETRSMTYELELQDPAAPEAWVRLARDTIDQVISVEGNSAEIIEIPIEFRYRELGPALRSLMGSGEFGYRVSGRINVVRPLSRSVPYRKTGRVTLEGAM